jgi:uncharacterized protein involved in type VI secretion and phage assembly
MHTDDAGGSPRRRFRMTLAEAEAIEERERRGELDVTDPEIAAVVGEAHQRIQRDLMWGGEPGDKDRRRTWFVVLTFALSALVTAAALLIPLLLSFRPR